MCMSKEIFKKEEKTIQTSINSSLPKIQTFQFSLDLFLILLFLYRQIWCKNFGAFIRIL